MNTMSPASQQDVGELERILSVGGGAMLLLVALRRAPLALVLFALGWALVYRGTKGQRMFSEALGRVGVSMPAPPRSARRPSDEQVDETVEESFPASDPPGWHTGSSFTQVSE